MESKKCLSSFEASLCLSQWYAWFLWV